MQDHSKGNQPTNQPYNAFNVILWHKHKRHCGFLCILYMILNTQSPAQQVLFSYIYYTYVVGNGIDWDYNPCCFMCQSWYHVRYRNIMVLQSSQLTSNAAQEEHICFTGQMNMIVAQIWNYIWNIFKVFRIVFGCDVDNDIQSYWWLLLLSILQRWCKRILPVRRHSLQTTQAFCLCTNIHKILIKH